MTEPAARQATAGVNAPEPDETWVALPASLDPSQPLVRLSRQRARLWQLVLTARLIPCTLQRGEHGWQVLVPGDVADRSLSELRQYQRENRGWPPPPPPANALLDNRFTTLCVLAAIGMFHNLTLQPTLPFLPAGIEWSAAGNAHAGKIVAGEWWRAVTALTLHNSGLHLMSNLVFGGVFIMRLCRLLGSGLGWGLTLASGIGGNLLNAWLQAEQHRAVGASTAVFGAVGLLAAFGVLRSWHNRRGGRRWLLPLAAGVGLLAMLGVGGEHTDIGAHLWGFACGLLLGTLTARSGRIDRCVPVCLGVLSGLASITLVTCAWWLALRG
ncbi:MAG: rhomboid family intramembrane serine protease [Desulfuromonadales bacterium]|nr:rhomboid family intramembrane serine protease [Desulfuromonadales bacterium]